MITIESDDGHHLVKQAADTATEYARRAFEFMKDNRDFEGYSKADRMAFVVGFMAASASDFHAAATASAGQHVARALDDIREAMDS